MIVVAQSDEPERLQARGLILARRIQHFGHAVEGTRSSVEGDLDEISGREFLLQLQQSAIERDGLKFGARPFSAFSDYRRRNGSIQFYPGCTLVDIVLGEVSHSQGNNAISPYRSTRLRKRLYTGVCLRATQPGAPFRPSLR